MPLRRHSAVVVRPERGVVLDPPGPEERGEGGRERAREAEREREREGEVRKEAGDIFQG